MPQLTSDSVVAQEDTLIRTALALLHNAATPASATFLDGISDQRRCLIVAKETRNLIQHHVIEHPENCL